MKYLLDTDTCSYISSGKPPAVRERFELLARGELGMSSVTYGELAFGCFKHKNPAKYLAILEQLSGLVPVLPLDQGTATHYGDIRAFLQTKGTPIGPNDLWIAAHARSAGLTLVTNNVREFRRVPKLKVENWVG